MLGTVEVRIVVEENDKFHPTDIEDIVCNYTSNVQGEEILQSPIYKIST